MSELLHLRLKLPCDVGPEHLAILMPTLEDLVVQPTKPFEMDRWSDPALILQDVSFADHVHDLEQGSAFLWIGDDGHLMVAAQIVNFRKPAVDDEAVSRLHAFVAALSALSRAEPGSIVGGWQTDHLGNTHPVVQHEDGLVLCYGSGDPDRKPYVDFENHGPYVPVEAILPSDDGIRGALDLGIVERSHRS